jgi:hypothetical protein
MFANRVQIEMGKTLKTIQVYQNNQIYIYIYIYMCFSIFYVIEICSKSNS